MKDLREHDMYLAVKKWFQTSRNCSPVFADLPKEKWRVRVNRNAKWRDIDVIALQSAPKPGIPGAVGTQHRVGVHVFFARC
jgi:hypothetical protein